MVKNSQKSWKRYVFNRHLIFIIIGLISVFLLIVNSMIFFKNVDRHRYAEVSIGGYYNDFLPTSELVKLSENLPTNPDLNELKEIAKTISITLIPAGRYLDFHENWLLWLISFVSEQVIGSGGRLKSEQFIRPHEYLSNRIIYGGQGNCSESAVVFRTFLKEMGIKSREVGMLGHHVLELEYKNNWYLADANQGIIFPSDFDLLGESEGKYYLRKELENSNTCRVDFKTYEQLVDNLLWRTSSSYIPKMARIQYISIILVWFIPFAAMLFAYLLLYKKVFRNRKTVIGTIISCILVASICYIYINLSERKLKIGALLNRPDAQYELAFITHMRGLTWYPEDSRKLHNQAVLYLKQASSQGHVDANIQLGMIFYKGFWSQTINLEESKKWFNKAANLGSYKALYFLGKIYELENNEKAFDMYQSASPYIPEAALRLGILRNKGLMK